ncbi:MAG TPA: phenylalanine 4-monooxygenase, partial [Chitinophagaceae bacterium]|nr:phenylalanine 4-monooxygenase [Chitinophagaceae bacterium]
MPQQTYRYAACGGFNTVLDIFLFFVSYNYVFHKEPIPVYEAIVITPHIAAFLFAFLFTFPIGFYLSRYVVWQQTDTAKREQLMKYFIVVFGCIGLNYMFLKVLVEFFGWYPTPAK